MSIPVPVTVKVIVSAATARGNIIIMANHGVLTVGETLLKAFDRIEVLEASAKITLYTELLGPKRALSDSQLTELTAPPKKDEKTERQLIDFIVKEVVDKITKLNS